MYPIASDLASQLRWALTLSCVLWLWISHPDCGGLQCYHVSSGSGPHLPVEVGSGAATCPVAPDLASRLRWASTLPRVL
jgi:hypothetical protein